MKRWAILIGINKYQISDLPDSDICVENTLRLDAFLKKSGYETICMHDQLSSDDINFPNRGNILTNLRHLSFSASPEDLILFHSIGFFCHAPDTTESSILPQDADDCDESIRLEEIRSIVERSRAKWVCLFSDIALGQQNQLRSDEPSKNQAILWISLNISPKTSLDKRADSKEEEHQLLSQTLYDGLIGKADTEAKGFVSLTDLVSYIGKTLEELGAAKQDVNTFSVAQFGEELVLPPLVEFDRLSVSRQLQKKQCFTEPAIQLDLMLIPSGTFTMGSPEDELGRYDDEGPQHDVTVPTFLMGRYPVTQAQWRTIATRTDLKVNIDLDPDPSEFKGDVGAAAQNEHRPVEQVSWHDAVEFCQRLSRLTHHTYRLPTEAEWEYACRAGTDTPFHFGETITTDLANYRGEDQEDDPEKYPGNYGNGPKGVYRQETTSVNHFHPLANAFGLCDLHGNVWEWCLDHWHDNYEGAPTDSSAWLTDNEEAGRVRRGGSWISLPRHCRSACRNSRFPGDRFNTFGFRVICEAQDSYRTYALTE